MALTMQLLVLELLPWAFLLPPGAWAAKIIGGWEAEPHSRPYMAYLKIQDGDEIVQCGGFLVAKNFVLTAAHCWGDSIAVVLGAHNIKQQELSRQVIPVECQIPHLQYNDKPNNNDIMLLQLAQAAKLNGFVNIIALPPASGPVQPGEVCSVAGWGRTIASNRSSLASKLQEMDVEVLEDAECTYRNYNILTMLCVGDRREGKYSAKSDYGGPLVCRGEAQGIVSWGPENPPGVYTRVSAYSKWTQATMNSPQSCAPPGVTA